MIKATVNNQRTFSIQNEKALHHLEINGVFKDFEIEKISNDIYLLTKDKKTFEVKVITYNESKKDLKLKVNGTVYDVNLKDRIDFFLEDQGMTDLTKVVINNLKAPMPGLVLEVKVQEGMEVKEGEPVLILEAMKMENVIKSPTSSKIKKINISQGMAVEKNQILIEFDTTC